MSADISQGLAYPSGSTDMLSHKRQQHSSSHQKACSTKDYLRRAIRLSLIPALPFQGANYPRDRRLQFLRWKMDIWLKIGDMRVRYETAHSGPRSMLSPSSVRGRISTYYPYPYPTLGRPMSSHSRHCRNFILLPSLIVAHQMPNPLA